jgi:ABC-type multidrug transport system fused ATPase/permease subunit
VEQAMRGAPARATWNALLREHRAEPDAARGGRALGRSLVAAELAFDGVSCVFPGASNATPLRATGRLAGPGGLAIAGANGAGKSTLGLALLGLVRPTRGAITVDGVPLGELAEDALRSRVTYLPQGAFAASAASVAWHLRLVARERPSDAQIDAALGEVGLLTRLEEHGAKAGCAPRDVPAGELSGGERQRMHLARLFLEDSELVLLDEPEAALDDAGRALLRELLERLAKDRKVIVVAHDAAVVPASFARLLCERGETNGG